MVLGIVGGGQSRSHAVNRKVCRLNLSELCNGKTRPNGGSKNNNTEEAIASASVTFLASGS
eukprot:2277128-Pyramimonas_sp.AAC.1